MTKRIAPSEAKAQDIAARLQGQTPAESGKEFLSPLVQLATERVLQEALEQDQPEALGRQRYERHNALAGYRHGSEAGTLKTAEGVLRVKVPQVRGRDAPYRSQGWAHLAQTSEHLQALMVERLVGGRSQRDMEAAWEKARGHFVLSKSAISTLPDSLSQESEALRTPDLRGYEVAYLFSDPVYAPLRRWGSKTGVLCVGGSCVDGGKVLLPRSTANSESVESCRDVLRDLTRRGRQPPSPSRPMGRPG